jgi:hypothetical protein
MHLETPLECVRLYLDWGVLKHSPYRSMGKYQVDSSQPARF